MTLPTIKIGSRKSPLALWQAHHIQNLLQAGGCSSELVLMETKGDKILQVTISKIGTKGVFTEELEDKLASGEIDIAVHSAKDMPSRLPDEFEILAFTERENMSDVLVADKAVSLSDNLVIGTSSTRRVASLRHYYPHTRTVDVRGNLQTRIEKMRNGLCDALLLAYAGVYRMGFSHMIQDQLPLDQFIPAVGQGSLAIECHRDLHPDIKKRVRELTNHQQTERELLAERSFLMELEGGCSIPVFALCTEKENTLQLVGGIISLDGKERIEKSVSGANPVTLGRTLANLVLEAGGQKILQDIKSSH